MLLPKFELLQPRSLEEATTMLAESNGETRVIAGGTDILVQMKWRKLRPSRLVDIKALEELRGLRWGQDHLRIGALITHREIETNQRIWDRFSALAEACRLVGSFQIRSMGTIGGNLCNAAPSAESAPPLLVFDAQAVIVTADGKISLPLEDFFVGPGKTLLQPRQLLQGITLPYPPARTGSAYLRHSPRNAMDIATVGVAARVTLDEGGATCRDVRIALGAVAPTPKVARSAEEALRGKPLQQEFIRAAARLAAQEAEPITDIRASAGYRREIVEILTERALILAGQRADIAP
ncbi:MAG: xanthine dehydrogenase family protein subunit M [Dehalococcoidales bacterium]|nr:xanthine dehydrogenase family protein subunit M [Dehalococcoidales bacterium]